MFYFSSECFFSAVLNIFCLLYMYTKSMWLCLLCMNNKLWLCDWHRFGGKNHNWKILSFYWSTFCQMPGPHWMMKESILDSKLLDFIFLNFTVFAEEIISLMAGNIVINQSINQSLTNSYWQIHFQSMLDNAINTAN